MKLQITSSLGEFNQQAFLNAVQAHLRDVYVKGMRVFLLAAVPRIPIRTGFARSAFKNLEDIAGKVGSDGGGLRIRGTRSGGSREIKSSEYYYGSGGKILKTDQSGRQFATPPNEILNITGAKIAKGRTAFYFKFIVDITYVDLLDRTIWGAFKAGERAMVDYIKSNLSNGFPEVGRFLTRTTR